MQDVVPAFCDRQPGRQPGRRRRLPGYVAPTLGATFAAALVLHLLVELAGRIDVTDPLGVLAALLGAAAVVVVLVPFALLFAARARAAWIGSEPPGPLPAPVPVPARVTVIPNAAPLASRLPARRRIV